MRKRRFAGGETAGVSKTHLLNVRKASWASAERLEEARRRIAVVSDDRALLAEVPAGLDEIKKFYKEYCQVIKKNLTCEN